ncbi:MAG: sulfatase-like hydrolase/transferase [Burkholderiaceae bacterium]
MIARIRLTPHRARWLLAVKLALLALFIYVTNHGVAERVREIGLQPALAVFAVIWVMALLALACVAFSPKRRIRLLWTLVLMASSVFSLSFQLITAAPLSLNDFERLIGLIGFSDEVARFYGRFLMSAALWSALGAVALNLPPFASSAERHRALSWLRHTSAVQLLPILAICLVLYARGGMGSNGLPAQFTPLGFATLLAAERLVVPEIPPRQAVAIEHPGRAPLRNVIMIMDESIRGDYVDINHGSGVRTGLAQAGSALVNFGLASSQANCSAESNASLRFGVTRANHLRDLKVNPSLWQYAKKAGYTTSYLDAQRHGGRLQNLMDEQELSHIDRFIQLDSGTATKDRDTEIARRLRQTIDEPGQHFIYLNKMGCHFPYEGKYPADRALFTPTMRQTYFGTESAQRPSRPTAEADDVRARLLFTNSYRNCIAWNTSSFFDVLLAGRALNDTVIVYTSDHGQDFHEDGRPGFGTHCSFGPAAPGEGIVPLAVLTQEPATLEMLRAAAQINHGQASLFNVFPTLLQLMGYRTEDLSAANRFEPTLLQALAKDNQKFLSTFFVRFGQDPVWNRIRPRPTPGLRKPIQPDKSDLDSRAPLQGPASTP